MPPGKHRPGTTPVFVPGLASSGTLIVATGSDVFVVDPRAGTMTRASGLDDRLPTCLAVDPRGTGRAWCGTRRDGVLRSGDGGASWGPVGRPGGLEGRQVMALAASPVEADVVWAGTEPSQVWRSADGGGDWERAGELETLPSSSEWAFPPRPDTHHVRWIACHPREPGRLWAAIEAGALISTDDGGRSWRDRVPGGPFDTHELAIHPAAPDTLRVAAGDGYYQSHDGGRTWSSPRDGLEVGYLRSVAIDPGRPHMVVVSAASGPRSTYVAGRSDGRVYRRDFRRGDAAGGDGGAGEGGEGGEGGGDGGESQGRWERVVDGWPDPPGTIAPLLVAGAAGELWAADERGVHRSGDGGVSWRRVAEFPGAPSNLRGLVVW